MNTKICVKSFAIKALLSFAFFTTSSSPKLFSMDDYSEQAQNFLKGYEGLSLYVGAKNAIIEMIQIKRPANTENPNYQEWIESIDAGFAILSEIQNHKNKEMVDSLYTYLIDNLYEFHKECPKVVGQKIREFISKYPEQAEHFRSIFQEKETARRTAKKMGGGCCDLCVDIALFIAFYSVLFGITIGLSTYQ